MMIMKGELEDHELIRPQISEAGSWMIKFTVGRIERRMITNIKNIHDHMKKSGSVNEMRDIILACIMMEGKAAKGQ